MIAGRVYRSSLCKHIGLELSQYSSPPYFTDICSWRVSMSDENFLRPVIGLPKSIVVRLQQLSGKLHAKLFNLSGLFLKSFETTH